MSNRFNIDCAYPGFCALCFTEIAEFDGFYRFGETMRPKVIYLKPNFRQAMVGLSDGTNMTISLCDQCINFTPEDVAKIYENELNGWKREVNDMGKHLVNPEVVQQHLEAQSELSIVDRHDIDWTDEQKAAAFKVSSAAKLNSIIDNLKVEEK